MTRTPKASPQVGETDGGARTAVTVLIRRSSPKLSAVYDTYWRFAYERQAVYFRRLSGAAGPWTSDATVRAHRFTNAYRAADRVSQYLIRRVIYPERDALSVRDLVFRVLLFKFFNRIDTWELLEARVGPIRWETYHFEQFDTALTSAIDGGRRLYSAAYIMPAYGTKEGGGRKHRGHLRLIERMMLGGFAERLTELRDMAELFKLLRSYPMLGNFLAFQYAIDLNYSPLTDFSESDFVVAGPGARDGLRKVFVDPGGYDEVGLIRWVGDRQEQEFARLGLPFRNLWGRRLQLIDCQNLFCEVDKYARVHHPNVSGYSGRTRIKQRFSAGGAPPTPWFPPKWGLNDQIHLDSGAQCSGHADGLFDH